MQQTAESRKYLMSTDTLGPMIPPETLAEFLKRMRERTGLKQPEYVKAKGLPVKLRRYQQYETGDAPVQEEHYAAFAEALGVPEAAIAALAEGQQVDMSAYRQGWLAATDELAKRLKEVRAKATEGAIGSTRAATGGGKPRTPKKKRKEE